MTDLGGVPYQTLQERHCAEVLVATAVLQSVDLLRTAPAARPWHPKGLHAFVFPD